MGTVQARGHDHRRKGLGLDLLLEPAITAFENDTDPEVLPGDLVADRTQDGPQTGAGQFIAEDGPQSICLPRGFQWGSGRGGRR